jgi:hypothetical protein
MESLTLLNLGRGRNGKAGEGESDDGGELHFRVWDWLIGSKDAVEDSVVMARVEK